LRPDDWPEKALLRGQVIVSDRRIVPAVITPLSATKPDLAIAIDGPAGSGKTTVARLLAEQLGYVYVDTGAMYRAVTLRLLQQGVPFEQDRSILPAVVADLEVRLVLTTSGQAATVWLDNVDVSQPIRSAAVTRLVSAVSADPVVRQAMVRLQREMAANGRVVMEGRDIGTVVLPNAVTKVLLTAALRERAQRRAKELRSRGIPASRMAQYWAIRRRDHLDRHRTDSPLALAADATVVDSTLLGPAEVVAVITALHRRHLKGGVSA